VRKDLVVALDELVEVLLDRIASGQRSGRQIVQKRQESNSKCLDSHHAGFEIVVFRAANWQALGGPIEMNAA
jgi:hypothetical protein